jgi:hypothetical protein
MKTEDEVRIFYNEKLKELLYPLEEYRISKVAIIKRYLFIGSLLLIPAIIGICLKIPFLVFTFGLIAFILYGLAFQTINKMKSTLQRNFKNKILLTLLDFLFDKYEYIPNQRIAKSVLIKSKLFTEDITGVEGEDFMRFKIGDTAIMFCETDIYKRGKMFFHGIFICSTFNKYFTNDIVVLPKPAFSLFQDITRGLLGGFQRIKLEDIEFNRNFIVYGKDQVESRYILTPGLMSRMLNYKYKTKRKISFSFIDDRMYCIIPNYINLFEPALFNSFMDVEFIFKNYNPLKLYTDLVNDLNLNVHIWTKQ